MGSISSETNTSAFPSPDSAVEPPNARKFETSISVSSLAEKFEKSGDFSKSEEDTLTENRLPSESAIERSHPLPENNSENKSIVPDINGSGADSNGKAKDEIVSSYKNENCTSENSETDINKTAVIENGKEAEIKVPESSTDPETSVTQVINAPDVNISKPSMSAAEEKNLNSASQNGSGIFTDLQSSNEIQERVMYFLYKMAYSAENSVSDNKLTKADSTTPGCGAQFSLSESKQDVEGNGKKVTLKDLEQSFIDALNMVISKDEAKTTDTLPVPSIEITEASDREDSSSDEETKPKTAETEVKTSVEENSDTTQTKENEQSSSTTNSQGEVKDQSEVSAEERKAVFYISSSDLLAEPPQESVETSSELEQSSETVRPTSTRTPDETRSSCLRSKTCQGTTFAVSFILTVFGCMLYSFAHDKKVPDFCEYLGLVIAILSGVVGAVSCFCYSCLDILPGPSRAGYELIPDTGYVPSLPPQNEAATANAQGLDDSWSSEKERAFRRQNDMSSTRTSEASLKSDLGEYLVIKKNEHRELVDKTELLKKGVMELLDSFNAFMSKLEPIDKLVEMESGVMNG